MTHYIIHQFFQLNLKWWDINIGAIFTSVFTFCGQRILLFLNPEMAKDVLTVLTAGLPAFLTVITISVAIRRGNREIKKLDRQQEQDEEEHLLKLMKDFEDRGLIDKTLPNEEKIARTKNLSKLLRQ